MNEKYTFDIYDTLNKHTYVGFIEQVISENAGKSDLRLLIEYLKLDYIHISNFVNLYAKM